VIGGMLAASIIGIVFVPALFYFVEKRSTRAVQDNAVMPPPESSPAQGD